MTVPFQYTWLDNFFHESANLIFFVVTGYKFRPGCNNPYLRLPASDEEEDLEMDQVVAGEFMIDSLFLFPFLCPEL